MHVFRILSSVVGCMHSVYSCWLYVLPFCCFAYSPHQWSSITVGLACALIQLVLLVALMD